MNTNLGRTLVAVAVVPVAMGLAQTRYTVVTLAPTGNVFTADPMDRVGINSHGVAAGSLADPALGRYRAFVTRGTDVVDLGTLDDDPSARAHGINDAGVVVGASGTASFNRGTPPFTPRRAVSYVGGNVVDLAGTGSAAYAINNAGIAVGESGGSPVVLGDGVVRSLNAPVRLMGGRARGINNENIIVGAARVLDGTRLVSRAFRWTTYGNGTDLGTLGGTTAAAEAINDSGQIVGWSANRDGETHAFLHEDGAMRDLGSLGGESRATAINSAGQVVGYSRVGNAHRAFLYEGRTMIDLAEIAPPRDPTSRVGVGDYFYATGINDRGQVAGIGAYYTANGPPELRAFVLTPVVSVYPNIARLAAGDNLALQATSAQPVSSCQWRRNDTPIPGATAATTTGGIARPASPA